MSVRVLSLIAGAGAALALAVACLAPGNADLSPPPHGQVGPRSASSYSVENCRGVQLTPSSSVQRKLDSRPEGTTFCFDPGTYRINGTLVPKAYQKLIGTGNREAVISGARVVEASQESDYWVITGQPSLGISKFPNWPDAGQCRDVNRVSPEGMCVFKDQVFLDGQSLWQVNSLAKVRPVTPPYGQGNFYWDYAANEIYLATNPTGRLLEVSAIGTTAIGGSAAGVEIRNLVVEKFGNSVQGGALSAAANWRIIDSEIRLNHGGGVHMGPGTLLRGNYIHHNGQLGIHGGQETCAGARGLVVEDNEIAYNNAAGYNWAYEGGGSKWNYTDGMVVRNNYSHHNYGPGLWWDWGNIRTLVEGNIVEDNLAEGINYEGNHSAIIRNNVIRRNGLQHPNQGQVAGAGIFIDQSRDVEIYGNVVQDNAAGITAVQEPIGNVCNYATDGKTGTVNLYVHDNQVRQPADIAGGLLTLNEPNAAFYFGSGANNRWEANTYRLGDPELGFHFHWRGGEINAEAWRSEGQDIDGTF